MPWLRMTLNRGKERPQKVYVDVDDHGEVVSNGGRARIRYSLDGEKDYSAQVRALEPIPGQEPQQASAAPAPPADQEASAPPPTTTLANVKVVMQPAAIPETPPAGVVMAFTDGACFGNPGPAGIGVVLAFGPHRKELSEALGRATNNIAELTAIQRALEAVRDPAKPLHVYTDSSYAIGVLGRGWTARQNRELVDAVRERLAAFAEVTLFKVEGHAGHALNERADALAREAAGGKGAASEPANPAQPKPAQPKLLAQRLRVVEKPEVIPETPSGTEILVFTDGACTGNPGPAGLGVVVADGGESTELSEFLGHGTNNIAELTAILRALEHIGPTMRPIHLYTDSSYAIGVLAKGWKAKANPELIATIRQRLAELADVTLHKVRGHAGHALNERVDELAREAIVRGA